MVQYLVALVVPVPDKEIEFILRLGEWDGDDGSVVDTDGPEPACYLLKVDRGEIEEGADLVLGLENVCPVLAS